MTRHGRACPSLDLSRWSSDRYESEAREAPLRPGRRMSYIEPIVESLKDVLAPSARKRLSQALCTVMGTEAVIAVRDIGRASVDEALDATAWAARALLQQALAEASPERRKRGTAPRR